MNIAIIKDAQCIDVAVFADTQTAERFLASGVWPEADAALELPEGYGIGDSCIDGEWVKAPQPEPEPEPGEPDYMAFLAGLMEGYVNG